MIIHQASKINPCKGMITQMLTIHRSSNVAVSSLYFIQIYSPYQILVVLNSQSIPVISRAIFLLTSPFIVDLIAINPPYTPINHQKPIISTIYDFSQWYPHVIPHYTTMFVV